MNSIVFDGSRFTLCVCFSLRVLGYACCTRVGQYLIAAYNLEVQKNLVIQARQRQEARAAAEARAQHEPVHAPAVPAPRSLRLRARSTRRQRNRNAVSVAAHGPDQAIVVGQEHRSNACIPIPPQPSDQNVLALMRAEEEARQDPSNDVLQFVASVDFDTQSKKEDEAGAEEVNYPGEIEAVHVDSAPWAGLEEEGAVGGRSLLPEGAEARRAALLGMLVDSEEIFTLHYRDSAGCMQTESLFAASPLHPEGYPSADQEDGLRNEAPPAPPRPDPEELRAEVAQLIKTKILESESERNFEKKHEEVHQQHLREQNLPDDVEEEQHHFTLQVVGFRRESQQLPPPPESGSGDSTDADADADDPAPDPHSVKSASDAGIVAAKMKEQKNQDRKPL